VLAFLIFDGRDAAALPGPGQDHGRRAVVAGRLAERAVDRGDVVPVDLQRVPAEGAEPGGVGGGVPAVPRGAALAEPVDVDNQRQVAEPAVAGLLPVFEQG
jgi:hypothetical protein